MRLCRRETVSPPIKLSHTYASCLAWCRNSCRNSTWAWKQHLTGPQAPALQDWYDSCTQGSFKAGGWPKHKRAAGDLIRHPKMGDLQGPPLGRRFQASSTPTANILTSFVSSTLHRSTARQHDCPDVVAIKLQASITYICAAMTAELPGRRSHVGDAGRAPEVRGSRPANRIRRRSGLGVWI